MDLRTPMAESQRYCQALRLRRVPSALVRIPGASHAINARPSQMIAQVLNTAPGSSAIAGASSRTPIVAGPDLSDWVVSAAS